MSKTHRWIADSEQLAELVGRVGAGPLAVDTEADSFHHYREKVCLIQLSFDGEDVLLDTLSEVSLGPLAPVLANPAVRKIFHGSDYDLRLLHRDLDLRVRGLFDTMIAARLVGERSFGLASLLERNFGVRLDKRFQRADWSRRPLTDEMREYAATDTRHLAELAERLEERLTSLGRLAWASEEFERLERVRWAAEPAEEPFRRVKGSGKLDRAALAILRELHGMRDSRARSRDVPPFRVLRDEVLVRVAAAAASARDPTPSPSSLPPSWRDGSRRVDIVSAIERGLKLPEAEYPERQKRIRKRLAGDLERRFLGARADRDRLAKELDLDSSVLAPRALLERSIELLGGGGDLDDVPELRRWQAELLGPILTRWAG
jgi:ribonuclease D